jgi:hypothetical protein
MENSNHKLAISIIGLAILIAGGLYWQMHGSFGPKQPYAPEMARAGKLVEGLPEELILTEDGKVVSSHATSLNEATTSYVAVVDTGESYKTVYFKYVKYMRENGYEISSRPFYTTRASIFGTKGPKSLSINLSPKADGGSQLTLTWVSPAQI